MPKTFLALLITLGSPTPALAQFTLTPSATAQRDAAASAAASGSGSPTSAQPTGGTAPAQNVAQQDCSLSWAEIEAFARGKTVLKQTPTCYIFAGPDVFRR